MSEKIRANNRDYDPAEPSLADNRRACPRAVYALQGTLAHVPFSSTDFARMKQKEIEVEEQKFARLFPNVQ